MKTREQIYAALAAKFGAPFVTVSRRLKHWTDVPATQQPAIYVQQESESREWPGRIPGGKRYMNGNLIVYFRSDGGIAPSSVANPLLDAIDAALAADDASTGLCTLGGAVAFCRIDGEVGIDEGTQDNQGVIHIPIRISLF